jgi:hypothetical protein
LGEVTSTDRPNRSSSCGRNSPSSGLPDPTSTNRAGWRIDSPSRSTTFSPDCATSEQQVDDVILQQVDLVDIRYPRLARARRPGSNAFSPRVSAFDVQSAHVTRSSVAPSGRSITGVGRITVFVETLAQSGQSSTRAAVHRAPFDRGDRRQQRRQRAHGGGFAGAAVAKHQHAADAGIDGGQDHRRFISS